MCTIATYSNDTYILSISTEIALRWIPQDFSDYEWTLIQVMAWCRQAPSHCLSHCWPRFCRHVPSLCQKRPCDAFICQRTGSSMAHHFGHLPDHQCFTKLVILKAHLFFKTSIGGLRAVIAAQTLFWNLIWVRSWIDVIICICIQCCFVAAGYLTVKVIEE